jgi:hypothetical protein
VILRVPRKIASKLAAVVGSVNGKSMVLQGMERFRPVFVQKESSGQEKLPAKRGDVEDAEGRGEET